MLRHAAGYVNIINIDISDIVISQMQKENPGIKYMVMDALDTKFESNSLPYIIDKSLIDTILCYENSEVRTQQFINEMHRILAPGGIHISFSLHDYPDVEKFFNRPELQWNYKLFHIANPKREDSNPKRSIGHTVVVCQKYPCDKVSDIMTLPDTFPDEEYNAEVQRITQVGTVQYSTVHVHVDAVLYDIDLYYYLLHLKCSIAAISLTIALLLITFLYHLYLVYLLCLPPPSPISHL